MLNLSSHTHSSIKQSQVPAVVSMSSASSSDVSPLRDSSKLSWRHSNLNKQTPLQWKHSHLRHEGVAGGGMGGEGEGATDTFMVATLQRSPWTATTSAGMLHCLDRSLDRTRLTAALLGSERRDRHCNAHPSASAPQTSTHSTKKPPTHSATKRLEFYHTQ